MLVLGTPARADDFRPLIRGTVLSSSNEPFPRAVVQAVRLPSGPAEAATTGLDGTFAVSCPSPGQYVVFASAPGSELVKTAPVNVGPKGTTGLTLRLTGAPAQEFPAQADASEAGFLSAPLSNPVLTTAGGQPLTLRAAGVVVAVAGAVLTVLLVLVLRRSARVDRRALSSAEAADLVVNARRTLGNRLQARAYGGRGVAWSLTIDAEVMGRYLEARRYDLIVASFAAAGLLSVAVLGFGTALLVGQPRWLFGGVLLVAGMFVITPAIILGQALRARRTAPGRPPST